MGLPLNPRSRALRYDLLRVTASRDNEETIASSTPTPAASIPRVGGKAELVQSFVPGDVLAGRFRLLPAGKASSRNAK
jgi:hypothetical protein